MSADAGEIARALAACIELLAPELLPAGRRDGDEWRVGSLAGEPGQSLAVCLRGPKAGVWCDFATGEAGDALDLVAELRTGGDLAAALAWARQWLHMPAAERPMPPARRSTVPMPKADAEARQAAALRLFIEAQPQLAGTPAEAYLRGRGIDLAELGRQPRALRFHPACPCREAGRKLPALLAAIVGADGAHIGTHRTWLGQDAAGAWRKARLDHPRKVLGAVRGGTIRLWRGASRRPLREAAPGETVVLAEGIEDALACALLAPEWRVLAAVSAANMRAIELPPAIGSVVIAADNDPPGSAAQAAIAAAMARFIGEGRCVRVARSPRGKDFADALAASAG